jgi:hypothetical protein
MSEPTTLPATIQLTVHGERRARTRDPRRVLQLALASLWLLAAALQFQPFMFSRAFASQTLAGAAAGNPTVVAAPISWLAHDVARFPVAANALFACAQLAIAAGIAWRRTTALALAASIAWAVPLWWLGEGFGGVLTPDASPISGAPGAVILYALLAVLLWPSEPGTRATDGQPHAHAGRRPTSRSTSRPTIAETAVGATTARVIWLALWLAMAYLATQPATRSAQAPSQALTTAAAGQPAWFARLLTSTAGAISGHGTAVGGCLALAFALVGASVFGPPAAARGALLLAILVAALLGVFGQGLGGMLTGQGTDPGTGPPLILLALAYWPATRRATAPSRPPRAHILGRHDAHTRNDPTPVRNARRPVS